nr:enoyl-CoA hydratase/isomerase family protein [uncultured Halomonas sp.]
MSNESVTYVQRDEVAWIGFNRPESRNAMTWEMYDALEAHCDRLNTEDEVHAVVLHGVGGEAFVAGTDITQFAQFSTPQDALDYERRIERVVGKLETLNKPTIALIEGFCVGGGAALAMVCDFRYCTPTLKFGVPIAKTLGNTLSITNISRLIDMVGIARTKEVLMRARLLDAEEAKHAGLVNAVFSQGDIVDQVTALAAEFAKFAPLTVQASKALIGRVQAHRRNALADGDDWVTTCYMSDDFKAAVNKFVNKTPFEWTGR